MMQTLKAKLEQNFSDALLDCELVRDEITLHVAAEHIIEVCTTLRDDYQFEQLMDLAGVDYSEYGGSSWETKQSTEFGFSRAVDGLGHADCHKSAITNPRRSRSIRQGERIVIFLSPNP